MKKSAYFLLLLCACSTNPPPQLIDCNDSVCRNFFTNGNIAIEYLSEGMKQYYINGQIAYELRKEGQFYYDKDGKLLASSPSGKYVNDKNEPITGAIQQPCYDNLEQICYHAIFKNGVRDGIVFDANKKLSFKDDEAFYVPKVSISHYENGTITFEKTYTILESDIKFRETYFLNLATGQQLIFGWNKNYSEFEAFCYGPAKNVNDMVSKEFEGQQALEIYEKFKADPSKHPCPISK